MAEPTERPALVNAGIVVAADAGSEGLTRRFRKADRHYACAFLGMFLGLLFGLLIRAVAGLLSTPPGPSLEAVWTPRELTTLLARHHHDETKMKSIKTKSMAARKASSSKAARNQARNQARTQQELETNGVNGTTRFSSVLGLQVGLCPAECDCAYARASGIAPTDHDDQQPRRRPAGFSMERDCQRMTVSQYLAKVYPTAASRFAAAPAAENAHHFSSLHSYYDHGCDGLGKCGTPGVMLRSLYDDFLCVCDLISNPTTTTEPPSPCDNQALPSGHGEPAAAPMPHEIPRVCATMDLAAR